MVQKLVSKLRPEKKKVFGCDCSERRSKVLNVLAKIDCFCNEINDFHGSEIFNAVFYF